MNAILRNFIRNGKQLTLPEYAIKRTSIEYSAPEELVRELMKNDALEVLTCKHRDGAYVRRNALKCTEEEFVSSLSEKLGEANIRRIEALPDCWLVAGDLIHTQAFEEGWFHVQSMASQYICAALAPTENDRVLDICAAPGGKTFTMAEMMNGTGRVQAWEIHEHRTELIQAQARRLGLENIRPMVRDATKFREEMSGSMDNVLLDAPCTGLGFMAQKPDLKLRVTEESCRELTELQAKLLDTVSTYVKSGGTMVYSTCSILKDENERQAEAFLQRHPEFEEAELPETIPERFRKQKKLGLQLLEYRDGVEGFYLIRMRKKYD